ncbi:MAG TPA: DASS family sodium-coupled anion symporter [Saprospiraceae bacterium]|nr:DASS family sodium-coupled anion symporter [Saprospiraceae bacterium]
MNFRKIALLAGPALFLLMVLIPAPPGMSWAAQLTAGITLWIAVWWISEPVEMAATSLLPLILLPLTGVASLKVVAAEYGNEIIFLFMAGFFMGKAVERWQLHRRIALRMVWWIGADPSRTVLGFMVATAFISMWISNTATAVMMTPVAIAVAVGQNKNGPVDANFAKALLLGVGYACSIGGLATVIGTPTNAIFLSYAQQKMGETVSFGKWLMFGLPFTAALLLICWQLLIRMFPFGQQPGSAFHSRAQIKEQLQAMGTVSVPERRVMWIFGAVILAWVSGSLIWYKPLNLWIHTALAGMPVPEVLDKVPAYCSDTVVALIGALLFFTIPAGDKQNETTLLDWPTAVKIPWAILILFGGGLALAKGFDLSGLAGWFGEVLKALGNLPHALILLVVLAVVVILSEVASNIATASMMMPVLAALAGSLGAHPFGLLMSATLAASFGFGLPIATAPNSIVYASGQMSTRDMARAGFLLDALAILLLLGFVYGLLPFVWGIRV